MKTKSFHYGGQAVIGGVLMLGKENMATSVRHPDGEIVTTSQSLPGIYRGRLRKIPLLRGIIVLVQSLITGIQALFHSAQIASGEEGEEEKLSPALLWGTFAASVAFTVAIFFVTPLLITRHVIDPHIQSVLLSNIVEGLLRIGVFLVYLKLIGLMSDIRDVFACHGAEHKVVNAHEKGCSMEIEKIRDYSTAHARCGTSFLFAVLIISILVFALLGHQVLWLSILSRIILLPLVAAISYEITQLVAKLALQEESHVAPRSRNLTQKVLTSVLLSPGLMLQSLTTREPSDAQLEVALSALNRVIEADKHCEEEKEANPESGHPDS